MRLLNTKSYELRNFIHNVPPYAILSHTWGDEEVTFKDITSKNRVRMKGWEKILHSCNHASEDGWEYIWIDTCCIDKSDSTELGEAINSMFHWYEEAQVCYAFLADVPARNSGKTLEAPWNWYFRSSRWFTRGWTLQELLAPTFLLFLDAAWAPIGSREQWADEVAAATGITAKYLADFRSCCVATKLSWAANRQTTREEDRAYSLLGLLGVNMPLIYGEGKKAFTRLQHELIRSYNDETIFAWGLEPQSGRMYPAGPPRRGIGVLATSPKSFEYWNDMYPTIWSFDKHRRGFAITNAGLNINAELFEVPRNFDNGQSIYALKLNCSWAWPPLDATKSPIVLFLQSVQPESIDSAVPSIFKRINFGLRTWREMSSDEWRSIGRHDIFILESGEQRPEVAASDVMISFKIGDDEGISLGDINRYSYSRAGQTWDQVPTDLSVDVDTNTALTELEVHLWKDECIKRRVDTISETFWLIIKSSPGFPSVGVWKDPPPSIDDIMVKHLDRERLNYSFASLEDGQVLQVFVIPKPVILSRAQKEVYIEIVRTHRDGYGVHPPTVIFNAPGVSDGIIRIPGDHEVADDQGSFFIPDRRGSPEFEYPSIYNVPY